MATRDVSKPWRSASGHSSIVNVSPDGVFVPYEIFRVTDQRQLI